MTTRSLEPVPLLVLTACALLIGAPSPVTSQHLTPTGAEFQINAFTAGSQNYPAIAADGDGDFVVVWPCDPAGGDYDIVGRRFTSAGVALGVDFQVNSHTSSNQHRSAVASADDGSFVVAWQGYAQDGAGTGVFARRFSTDGTPQATEFQVNTYTAGYQSRPSVASDPDGDFVIAWTSDGQDGYTGGVFARRFNSGGMALGVEFQVNTYTEAVEAQVAVSSDDDGDFVIVWTRQVLGGPIDVFGRRFDSSGAPQASEFLANSSTADTQVRPDVAHDSAGGFVLVWQSFGLSESDIIARRFDSNGSAQGGDFRVNSFASGYQSHPRLAFDSADDLVVVWRGSGPFGDQEVFARAFDSGGTPKNGDFQVNSTFTYIQAYPVVASTGSFVVAWMSQFQEGSGTGIFARRLDLSALPALDLDGDGTLGPLTDGLLFLRLLFGFSGTTLTTGAVGGACTRCDGASITAHVAGYGFTLDIDGDVQLQPLTDGLLVLRYLFGFTGTALTTGAVGAGCSRCDAAAIVPYLQTLD